MGTGSEGPVPIGSPWGYDGSRCRGVGSEEDGVKGPSKDSLATARNLRYPRAERPPGCPAAQKVPDSRGVTRARFVDTTPGCGWRLRRMAARNDGGETNVTTCLGDALRHRPFDHIAPRARRSHPIIDHSDRDPSGARAPGANGRAGHAITHADRLHPPSGVGSRVAAFDRSQGPGRLRASAARTNAPHAVEGRGRRCVGCSEGWTIANQCGAIARVDRGDGGLA